MVDANKCKSKKLLIFNDLLLCKSISKLQKSDDRDRYSVCHGIRLTKQDDYLWVSFNHFWSECHFFRAAGVVGKIDLSLKQNPHYPSYDKLTREKSYTTETTFFV